jgi:hypothetical protein
VSAPSWLRPNAATVSSIGMRSLKVLTIWVSAFGRPTPATCTIAVSPDIRAYPSPMATQAPSWMPLMSWIERSLTSAS